MEILAIIKEKLKDGRTALAIKDAYNPNYAIVSNFDNSKPMGDKWSSAEYFDGNFEAFMEAYQTIEQGIGYNRAIDIIRETFSHIANDLEDPCMFKDELEAVMDEDEIKAVGFDLDELKDDYER